MKCNTLAMARSKRCTLIQQTQRAGWGGGIWAFMRRWYYSRSAVWLTEIATWNAFKSSAIIYD